MIFLSNISMYSVINLFAFLVCLLILLRRIRSFDGQKINKIFIALIISAMGILFMDYLWGIYSEVENKNIIISYLINAMYYVFLGSTPLIWFIYSETVQDSSIIKNKKLLWVCCIPTIIYYVLIITSAFGYGLFYIDSNGEYARGQLYLYQVIECYAYLIVTCVKASILSFKKENYVKKNSFLILAGFIFAPVIFGIFQVFSKGNVPYLALGIALAIAQAHIQMQEEQISLDSLTGINNRSQMIKYLSSKINEKNSNLYLVILDLENFKSINDMYGHVEGDNALIRVANVLKLYSNKYKAFISRYAGDEFIMIINTHETLDSNEISNELNQMIQESNDKNNVKYKLKISVGLTLIDHKDHNIPKYIELADKALYENKKR